MHRVSDHPPWRMRASVQPRAPAGRQLRDVSLLAVAFVLAAVAWQERALAQSGTWTAVSGSWSTGTNWSGNNIASGTGTFNIDVQYF